MSFYDPKENIRRLQSGLIAAIAGKPKAFDDERGLLAVFSGEPHVTDQTRIVVFQKFLSANLPARPIVTSMAPGCLRVWFSFPEAEASIASDLLELAATDAFAELCMSLGVASVICGGKNHRFPERDFSQDIVRAAPEPRPR
jgi:hypothetical protein